MAFVAPAGASALAASPHLAGRCTSRAARAPAAARRAAAAAAAAPRMQQQQQQQQQEQEQQAGGPARSRECDTPLKRFLDALKPLGKTRLIVQNDAGIMEAVADWDGLFFATIPSGEYANLIDHKINLDLHLRLGAVTGARFVVGVARSASKAATYAIRLLGPDKTTVVLSVFLQWDKEPEDIAPERVEYWNALKHDYAGPDTDTFFL